MLWEVEIHPATGEPDREGQRVLAECQILGTTSIREVQAARSFLIEGNVQEEQVRQAAEQILADIVAESYQLRPLADAEGQPAGSNGDQSPGLVNVLFKPGVTDNVATTTKSALQDLGLDVEAVATTRKYWMNDDAQSEELERAADRILANDAIEQVVWGPLKLTSLAVGSDYAFELRTVAIRAMSDEELLTQSKQGQLYLSLEEMQTIQQHFVQLDRDPTDVELETIAQTWSEHCSHKTLAGRIRYRDENGERCFDNMLKETIFAATMQVREDLGRDDWCVSVFADNAGVVTFDEQFDVCFKVETHNHPSALEPYGGANTGIGGVIRDPLGTGMGAKPICNTDIFCFAPPDVSYDSLPPGVLHPQAVMRGVVAGVRDYGNRMGIPTVNGALYFDERYLGNPLVYCGNVAMIPVGQSRKNMQPGDYVVAVGGRTGRDGIHGATFSSAELTEDSEELSGGAVQIGNAITEKMMADVLLEARDRKLYSAVTDCGAGGFSSAVGEMGEKTGAEVWLEKAPLKYSGLSYTEIWISEAQERMVVAVPPANWEEFHEICAREGVEATVIGEFTETKRLVLKYEGTQVADLSMDFLHDGRPPVLREAVFESSAGQPLTLPTKGRYDDDLLAILGSWNVCSKEWVIRQYDHEVQAGSVVKPLVGVTNDGPSDAAVVRPVLDSSRGLVISCGMNPCQGDLDPYWMAASAIDEALCNCIAVGANPEKIAILDNFCWGNTERPETLGSLVRAAIACHDFSVAFGTPFVSGKDSLNNDFSYDDENGTRRTVSIPSSLLISALGQMDDVETAVTMDVKQPGNLIYQVGTTYDEMGGSHFALVNNLSGGEVPRLDANRSLPIYQTVHQAIRRGLIASCHDLREGGLAVAAAEMVFAGGFGLGISLAPLAKATGISSDAVLLFSESNTRFLIEVEPEKQEAFEELFSGLPVVLVGTVVNEQSLSIRGSKVDVLIDVPLSRMKAAWQKPLAWD